MRANELLEPGDQGGLWERIADAFAVTDCRDEPILCHHLQVVGGCRDAHLQVVRNLRDAQLFVLDEVADNVETSLVSCGPHTLR